jgi:hypothetical protein
MQQWTWSIESRAAGVYSFSWVHSLSWRPKHNCGEARDRPELWSIPVSRQNVEMAHMAIGHLEELKKKELVLTAVTITEEEFTALANKRNGLLNAN